MSVDGAWFASPPEEPAEKGLYYPPTSATPAFFAIRASLLARPRAYGASPTAVPRENMGRADGCSGGAV